jgi:hypothetical protein
MGIPTSKRVEGKMRPGAAMPWAFFVGRDVGFKGWQDDGLGVFGVGDAAICGDGASIGAFERLAEGFEVGAIFEELGVEARSVDRGGSR